MYVQSFDGQTKIFIIGEVGYARDACVELGRNLIKKLQLLGATEKCQELGKFQFQTK